MQTENLNFLIGLGKAKDMLLNLRQKMITSAQNENSLYQSQNNMILAQSSSSLLINKQIPQREAPVHNFLQNNLDDTPPSQRRQALQNSYDVLNRQGMAGSGSSVLLANNNNSCNGTTLLSQSKQQLLLQNGEDSSIKKKINYHKKQGNVNPDQSSILKQQQQQKLKQQQKGDAYSDAVGNLANYTSIKRASEMMEMHWLKSTIDTLCEDNAVLQQNVQDSFKVIDALQEKIANFHSYQQKIKNLMIQINHLQKSVQLQKSERQKVCAELILWKQKYTNLLNLLHKGMEEELQQTNEDDILIEQLMSENKQLRSLLNINYSDEQIKGAEKLIEHTESEFFQNFCTTEEKPSEVEIKYFTKKKNSPQDPSKKFKTIIQKQKNELNQGSGTIAGPPGQIGPSAALAISGSNLIGINNSNNNSNSSTANMYNSLSYILGNSFSQKLQKGIKENYLNFNLDGQSEFEQGDFIFVEENVEKLKQEQLNKLSGEQFSESNLQQKVLLDEVSKTLPINQQLSECREIENQEDLEEDEEDKQEGKTLTTTPNKSYKINNAEGSQGDARPKRAMCLEEDDNYDSIDKYQQEKLQAMADTRLNQREKELILQNLKKDSNALNNAMNNINNAKNNNNNNGLKKYQPEIQDVDKYIRDLQQKRQTKNPSNKSLEKGYLGDFANDQMGESNSGAVSAESLSYEFAKMKKKKKEDFFSKKEQPTSKEHSLPFFSSGSGGNQNIKKTIEYEEFQEGQEGQEEIIKKEDDPNDLLNAGMKEKSYFIEGEDYANNIEELSDYQLGKKQNPLIQSLSTLTKQGQQEVKAQEKIALKIINESNASSNSTNNNINNDTNDELEDNQQQQQ